MSLEAIINDANEYYLKNNIACIYKKHTPIGIVNVKEEKGKKMITKAFFKEASTLDYNGVYKGYYIEFDAKQTLNKTSFPLSNISTHQIDHIKNVIFHEGIIFLIIEINKEYYLLDGRKLLAFINNEKRKSIPYIYLKNNCYKITIKNNILNYIESIDLLLGGSYEQTKKTRNENKTLQSEKESET
jgi:recombination protein U